LEESVEIHHTDDGKTVRIKFRAAPRNEGRSIVGRVYDGAREAYGRVGELLDRKGESGAKRTRVGDEDFSESNMDLDRSEISASNHQQSRVEKNDYSQEDIFEMLRVVSKNLGKVPRESLVILLKEIKNELKRGEKYSQIYKVDSQELEKVSQKLENFLNTSQASVNPNVNEEDNKISTGSIIAVISTLSAFSVGIALLIKRKLSIKNKKK